MKKWLLLLTLSLTLTALLSVTTVKVAVLPLKRLDSPSKYIQKIMTIRDLQRTFDKEDKFELIDLKTTAEVFNDLNFEDIDEMEKEDMAEIGRELKADVVVLGSISTINEQTYSIQFRFYSMRTGDIVSQRIDVAKDKKKRWQVLDNDFMGKLTAFVEQEQDKIMTLAVQDYQAENFDQAEQGFINLLNYNPENKQAYYYLGLINYQKKNYPDAITNFNKSLSDTLSTNDINALAGLANVYRDTGNKEMLINTLVKQATIQEDEELWLNIANLYAEIGQNIKAKEALQEALRINPDFTKAHYRMAFLLYDMGEYNEAIPYLEKAVNENPDNDFLTRRLAFAYQKAGRIDEAISRYESVIVSNPTSTQAYLNLAGLYRTAAGEAVDKGNTALANEYNRKTIATLDKMKAVDPENPTLYLRYADVYLSTNRLAEAEANANLALSKDPTLYQPYVILATINQRRGSEKYNQFIDLEKKAREAYGRTATRLSKERDAARIAANAYFRKADEQLRAAKVRTDEPEALSDINSKLTLMAQLIDQTSKIY
ncbi:MAG TPA: tetratricopeptide repeat protein [Candidatus Cloacimonadota bacterium]|nr:tetratricopeptide repeat protein [Candidatus Cloacimonadota bacterium]HQL14878.1 tetratricopeptide repeat protein [Candidatus Cloacimonadota bacterium]